MQVLWVGLRPMQVLTILSLKCVQRPLSCCGIFLPMQSGRLGSTCNFLTGSRLELEKKTIAAVAILLPEPHATVQIVMP